MTIHILYGAGMPRPSAIPMIGADGLLRFAVDPNSARMMADTLGRLAELLDRAAAEAAIERLIALLDWKDGDADLEPTMGWLETPGRGAPDPEPFDCDEMEDENEHGGDVGDEPHDDDELEHSLGWSERDGQGPRVGFELSLTYAREADHDHV